MIVFGATAAQLFVTQRLMYTAVYIKVYYLSTSYTDTLEPGAGFD